MKNVEMEGEILEYIVNRVNNGELSTEIVLCCS